MLHPFPSWFALSFRPQFNWPFVSLTYRAGILYRYYTKLLWMLDTSTAQRALAILGVIAAPRVLNFLPCACLMAFFYFLSTTLFFEFLDDNPIGVICFCGVLFMGSMGIISWLVGVTMDAGTYLCTNSHLVILSTADIPAAERSILFYILSILVIMLLIAAGTTALGTLPILDAEVLVLLCERHKMGQGYGLLETKGLEKWMRCSHDLLEALEKGDDQRSVAAIASLENEQKINEILPMSSSSPAWAAGRTPIGMALKANASMTVLNALLEANADANMKDDHGKSAISIASRNGNTAFLQELQHRGGSIDTSQKMRAYMMRPVLDLRGPGGTTSSENLSTSASSSERRSLLRFW